MELKSLTYTSMARLDLTAQDIIEIHRVARERNALDGITGLLIFNGTHFLQVVEGTEPAIEDLVGRLRKDPRHHYLEVRDEQKILERRFPDWSMEFVRVSSKYFEARDAITDMLPPSLPNRVSAHILAITEKISGTVELPD